MIFDHCGSPDARPAADRPGVDRVDRDFLMELWARGPDQTNEGHVVAMHEAAHAFAIERTGATVVSFWIKHDQQGWEGDASHSGRPELDDFTAAELDRMCYLSGPMAEEKFAGTADFEECAWDRGMVDSISVQLPDYRESLAAVRTRVDALLDHEASWMSIQSLALEVLKLEEGNSVPHETVEPIVTAIVGPRPAPGWTVP